MYHLKRDGRRLAALVAVAALAAVATLGLAGRATAGSHCSTNATELVCANDFDAVAGVEFSGPVGGIEGPLTCPTSTAVGIDWGDGDSSTGTVTCQNADNGTVSGTHTYDAAGTYTVTLTWGTRKAASTATVAPAQADLGLTMTGPASVRTNQALIYSINVGNAGPQDAANVKLTDQLPYGTTFLAVTATGWSCSSPSPGTKGGTVTCTLDPFAALGSVATSIGVSVKAPPGKGAVTNAASVSSDTLDPSPANNSASVITAISNKK